MKITIFLDVDGVLNGFSKRAAFDPEHIWQDGSVGPEGRGGLLGMRKSNVDHFKYLYDRLIQKHKVSLVLSSSWRVGCFDEFKDLITKQGFYSLEWNTTPNFGGRGREIASYLAHLSIGEQPDCFIIIDDEMYDIEKYFTKNKDCYLLHTNGYKGGLTQRHVNRILNRIEMR